MIIIKHCDDNHQERLLIFVPLYCTSNSFHETLLPGYFVHFLSIKCNCPKKEFLETA